jgi:hypothetical protein
MSLQSRNSVLIRDEASTCTRQTIYNIIPDWIGVYGDRDGDTGPGLGVEPRFRPPAL